MTTIRFNGREIQVPDADIDSFDNRLGDVMFRVIEDEINIEQASRELGVPAEFVEEARRIAETNPDCLRDADEMRDIHRQREQQTERALEAMAWAAHTKEGRDYFRKNTGRELVPMTDYYNRRYANTERFPTTELEMRKCLSATVDDIASVLVCEDGHPILEYYKRQEVKS